MKNIGKSFFKIILSILLVVGSFSYASKRFVVAEDSGEGEEITTTVESTPETQATETTEEENTPSSEPTATPIITELPSSTPEATSTTETTFSSETTASPMITITPSASAEVIVYQDSELSTLVKEYYELEVDEDASSLIKHTIYIDLEGNYYFYGFIVGQEEGTLGFYQVDLETKEFTKADLIGDEEELIALITGQQISTMAYDPDNLYVASDGSDSAGDGSFEHPYLTVTKAYSEASTDATIYIKSNINITNLNFNAGKKIILTSCDSTGAASGAGGPIYTMTDVSPTGTATRALYLTSGELTTTYITFDGDASNRSTNGSPLEINGASAKWNLNEKTTIQNFNNTSTTTGGILIARVGELNANGAIIQNNTVSEAAAGIYFLGTSTGGNIANCSFINNASTKYGTLVNTSSGVVLNVTGSTFTGNTSAGGGNSSNGAAIYTTKDSTIDNSTFTGNSAGFNGGAISTQGNITVIKSNFSNNTTVQHGGAIYESSAKQVTITDSNFKDNIVTGTVGRGGAIYAGGPITINTINSTSTFNGNISTNNGGGAVYTNSPLIVTGANPHDIVFSNNQSYSHGGAIMADKDVTLTNVDFTDNQTTNSAGNGGAVYFSASSLTQTLTGVNFTGNTSLGSAGGAFLNGTATVTNSTFVNNTSAGHGGGMLANNGNVPLTITNGTFTGNKTTGGRGGAIYGAGIVNITSETGNVILFDGNSSSGQGGGAVFSSKELSIIAVDQDAIKFTNNQATQHGGAVLANTTSLFENIVFTGNKVTVKNSSGNSYNGGAVYATRSGSFTNCTFDQNEATNGGAINLQNGVATIDNSSFTNNKATVSGGAVYVYTAQEAIISNSEFDSNSAVNYSGAINADILTLTNSTITNNTAKIGGGYAGGNSDTPSTITGSTISNNTATTNGGAIYTNGKLTITDTTIGNNNATTGAGIYAHAYQSRYSNIILENNATVTDNISSGSGAGVYLYAGTSLNMTGNAAITNNFATIGDGGGVYLTSTAKATMQDTASITGNHCAANKNSGGVYNLNPTDGSFKIQDNVVINNNYYGTGSSDIYAANYYINNTAAAKATYDITISGPLGDDAQIGIMTRTNMKDILVAKPDTGYTITTSDLEKFTHDRITRGQLDGMPIVFDVDGSTGSTNNLELYASQYKEIHIFNDVPDPEETFVGAPGTNANTAHYEPKYGYTLDHISAQSSLTGNVEQTVATGENVVIPDNDSLIIRYYNNPNDYTVKFEMEKSDIGSITNGSDQTISYKTFATMGATAIANDPVNYYFTGWKYEIETENGIVFGNVMDYTTVPITGDVTFVATFAKVPFIEIDTPISGSVSVINGTTSKPITDNTVYDRYEWPENEPSPYQGIGSFKANPNYKVKSIIVNIFGDNGGVTNIPLTNGSSTTLTGGGTAVLTLDANGTYGNVQLSGLQASAQITVEFEKLPTVNVIYDANGGTPNPFENREIALGNMIGSKPVVDPTRDEYRLVGWSTDPNATFDEYNADYIVTPADVTAGTITYYAVWDKNSENEYDILVYLQTGVDGSNNPTYTLSSDDSYLRATAASGTVVYAYDQSKPGPKDITGYTWNATAPGTLITGTVEDPEKPRLVLRLYYDANQYELNYYVNGGSAVTTPQQVYYKDILPTVSTTKTGYTLEGWYREAGFINKVVLGTDTMPAYDLDLYARWVSEAYDITYVLDGGTNNADNPSTYDYGVGVTFKNPNKSHYDFDGWFEESSFTTQITQISTTDMGDKTVYAKWTPTEYTITYTLNGGTVSSSNPTTYNVETSTFTLNNPTKTGYTFDGWTGTGIVTASTSVSINQGSYGNRNYTANFSPISYTVSFDANGGTGGPMAAESFDYNETKALTTNVYTKAGYTFGGWAESATGAKVYDDAENVSNLTTTDGTDIPLFAVWTPNDDTAYKVEHYKQNVDGTYPTTASETEDKTGTTATTADATAKTYAGFTHASTTYEDNNNAASTTVLAIAADGSLVIKLYYDRNKNDISYSSTIPTGCSATVPSGAMDVLYGTPETVEADLSCPGYTFSGWTTSDVTVSASDTFDMPDNDVSFAGSFTENQIDITYQPNNTHGSVSPTSESILASIGTAVGSSATADTGYKFTEWTRDSAQVSTSAIFVPSKNTTTNVYETATYVAHFVPINYEVVFDKNANDATGTMANESFEYDETKALTSNAFTRTGYTFGGWSKTPTGSLDFANGDNVNNLTTTDNSTVTLYALWTPNDTTAYKVEHYQQDITGSGYTLKDTDNKTGTTATTADVTPKTYTGFAQDTSLTTYEDSSNTASATLLSIAPDGTLVVKLYYNRNTHDISYSSTIPTGCSATVPNGATGVRYETNETVEADLSCAGYTFSGWTPTGVTISGTTYTMPDNDVSFTGTWTANTGTAYKVEHYQQDLTGSTYTLYDTENKGGTTASTADATPKTYTGFTNVAASTTYEDTNHAASNTVLSIAADGSLIIKLYYDRNTNDITYSSTIPAGCSATVPSGATDVLYGTSETVESDLSCAGYTFSGWTPTGVTVSGTNYTMPDNDVSFTGTWDEIQVVINYNTNNTHGSITNTAETVGAYTGTPSGSTATEDTGYKFTGWTTGGSSVGTAALYVPVKDTTTNLFVAATYTANFEPIAYEIAFNKNAIDATGTMANENFEYDDSKALTTNAFTRVGYTFGGWATSPTGAVVYNDNDNVSNLTTTDGTTIDLYAVWTPNTTTAYKVEHYQEDLTGGTYTLQETENKTGSTATAADITPKTYAGFTQDTSLTTYADSAHTTAQATALTISADGSLIVRLYYTRNTYSITYNMNGGTNDLGNPTSYTYGDTITFNDPTYTGHTFGGWYTDASFTTPITGVSVTDTTDLTLYAKWSVNPTPNPATPNPGRTCQDDGYPAGWYWDGSACVAPSSVVTPTPVSSSRPVPTGSPIPNSSANPSTQTSSSPDSSSDPTIIIVPSTKPDSSASANSPSIGDIVIVDGKEYTIIGQNDDGLWIVEDGQGNEYVLESPEFGVENNHWALVNLIAALITLILGVIHLIEKSSKEEDQEDENGNPIYVENGEVKTTTYQRHKLFKYLSCILGVAAIFVFILTENLRNPMILVDKWTIVMIIILAISLISFILGLRWKKKDDNNQAVQE